MSLHNSIDINDLASQIDQIRALSGNDQIVVTASNAPIARLLPLPADAAPQKSRLSNPFLNGTARIVRA